MITVEKILGLQKLQNIQVAAGKGGLWRRVSHVTVMEVPDIAHWLKGSDFLITSLYALKDDIAAQCGLLRDLASASCACMAVKTGQYVKDLAPELRVVADELDFPLLIIPYELSYIDIITSCMDFIFEERNPRIMLERYIRDVLFEAYGDPDLMIERGRLLGFETERDRYLAMTLQFSQAELPGEEDIRRLWRVGALISQFAAAQKGLRHCTAVHMENHSSILLDTEAEDLLPRIIPILVRETKTQLRHYLRGSRVYISYGNAETGLEGIRATYFDSIHASRTGQIFFPGEDAHWFRNMELYCIMAEAITKSKGRFFKGLQAKISGKETLETLTVYFETGKNIQQTAERLHTHKNTIKYRLQRVRELTGLDVKNFNQSMTLYMAVMARKLGETQRKSAAAGPEFTHGNQFSSRRKVESK
ncbi:MAG: PucR family transcriptional regulator ligand-binding domain-containing protein [Treponema sp.]|jgi:purine catabolism regulator|nr:PucR family transcriptional regulator ligand-binding domain-containing protein [Treponema sp.]